MIRLVRRRAVRWALGLGLSGLVAQQGWRHGHDYVFPEAFAVVEEGKLYRGAWQKDWPMRSIVRDRHIKTIVALAHAPEDPLAIEEKALADSLGVRWIHIPIVDDRNGLDGHALAERLDQAADALADPANQPVYFHCHHGLNRASMVQIAYRVRNCGWGLEEAAAEVDRAFGLVAVNRGPDFRSMERYVREHLHRETRTASGSAGAATRR